MKRISHHALFPAVQSCFIELSLLPSSNEIIDSFCGDDNCQGIINFLDGKLPVELLSDSLEEWIVEAEVFLVRELEKLKEQNR